MDDARGDFLGPANGTSSRHPKEVGDESFYNGYRSHYKDDHNANIYYAQYIWCTIFDVSYICDHLRATMDIPFISMTRTRP